MIGSTRGFPRSLWLDRPGAPAEVDVAVVGGGIVGLSTAWWLARLAPAGFRLLVLEADHLAARASGRNAGFLLTGTPEPFTELAAEIGREAALGMWHRSRENRELVRAELLDGGRVDADFLPEGSWLASLASNPGQEAALEESCTVLREEGFDDLEWRSAAEVQKASGSERLGGAIFQARDGGLDPVRLCRGLAADCADASPGFELHTGARVHALGPAVDGRVLLSTTAGEVHADQVLVAVNARAGELLPHLASEVRPVRGQMLATEAGERPLTGVWYINDGHEYLRQLADGRVVLGGARQTAAAEEVGHVESPTAGVQGALETFLANAFPHLAGRRVTQRWAGTMAFTPDGLPRLGEVPGVSGARYAVGFNGHGMSLGFVTGRHLARQLLGEAVGELLPPSSSAANTASDSSADAPAPAAG